MLRCVTVSLLGALLAAGAAAQLPRQFPAQALRGEIAFLQPPEVQLNGKAARLAPGARIRDERNMLALPGALVPRSAAVHYTRGPEGLLMEVWLLTPAELARRPWPATAEEAARWSFDPVAQTWSRP